MNALAVRLLLTGVRLLLIVVAAVVAVSVLLTGDLRPVAVLLVAAVLYWRVSDHLEAKK